MSKRQLFLLIAVSSVLFVALTGCDETDELSPVLTRVEANIECGYAPMDVQFVAIASGGNPVADPTGGNAFLNFDWDFGDGDTEIGSVTHHIFDVPDTYEVKIRVTDDDGDAVTESLFIEVRADSMIVTTSPDTTLIAMLDAFENPTLGTSNSVFTANPIEGLFINEVLIINESAFDDETGNYQSVLEIYNNSCVPISLIDYTLALDLVDSELQHVFGNTPVVDPGEYQVIWLDGTNQDSENPHTSFSVEDDFGTETSEVGDTIYLLRNDILVDSIRLGPQQADVSFGRIDDGTTEGTFETPTLGQSNFVISTDPLGGLSINEVLIINETAYHGCTGNYRSVLEIYNSSDEPISLRNYTLALDLIDSELQHDFGNTPVVDPGEYQVIWLDGTNQDSENPHTSFSIDDDFGTETSEAGDTIYLLRNNTPIDSIRLGPQQADVSFGRIEDGTTEGTLMLNAWASLCGFDTDIGDYSRFDFVWQIDDELNSVYLGRHPSHMFTRADVGVRVVSLSLFDRFSSVYRTTTINITVN